jgi:signal transduction histidine kinase
MTTTSSPRAEILESWQRARLSGLNPAGISVPYQPDAVDAELLVLAAAPVLDEAARDLEGTGASLLLAQDAGYVVDHRAPDHDTLVRMDRSGLMTGFVFSEDRVGTNGIGTTLAQEHPITVIGPEHYAESLRGFACSAAPILEADGGLAGAFNIGLDATAFHPTMPALARRVAREITERLQLMAPHRAAGRLAGLTHLERKAANLLVKGSSARQIALALGLDLATATLLIGDVYRKLGVDTRLGLAKAVGAVEAKAGAFTMMDDTRREIERNLHDGVQQQLIGLGLKAGALQLSMPEASDETRAQLADIRTGLREVHEQIRQISRGTYPRILGDRGLEPALRDLSRLSPVPVRLRLQVPERLPRHIESGAYYFVSEALANVVKHADATRADVVVTIRDRVLTIAVADDGKGCPNANERSLASLRDRVATLGGSMTTSRPRKGGLRVQARIWVSSEAPGEA